MEGLRVQVSAAEGEKCARCWHVLPDVNTHAIILVYVVVVL
ncbi:zinc finger domain-containing protein [Acinetobacter baumannii]|nr:zinc finger domain-containing protein [Acinetobacter baumannii]MCT2436754.1 hypothetical protein [Acinetobacter baumannii]